MNKNKAILRAFVISLTLMLGVGVIMPLSVQLSEANTKNAKKKVKKVKKVKKYSRQWWKLYRARMKKKRALEARKRALMLRRAKLAKARKAKNKSAVAVKKAVKQTPKVEPVNNSETEVAVMDKKGSPKDTTVKVESAKVESVKGKKGKSGKAVVRVAAGEDSSPSPFGNETPKGWAYNKSSSDFSVADNDGNKVGSAAVSVVGPSLPNVEESSTGKAKSRTVGGIPTSALRKNVINQMLKEDGWIVNDYQKEVNGRKVFVVVAQAPGKDGSIYSRVFYFTEVEGKIYSVATSAPTERSEKLAQDSEKVINLLQRGRSTQTASDYR